LLLLVQGLDLLGDGEVLVGDGAVGDAGVDQGHGHRLVPEERGDGFQAHPAVDGLGGQGVPQLVWVDVADTCCDSGCLDSVIDPGGRDRPTPVGEQQRTVLPVRPVGEPVVDHRLELWVQWDVAVVVKFTDGDA